MKFNKKVYKISAIIYGSIYLLLSIIWEIIKISWGCPCGFVAECMNCSVFGGFLESFIGWGFVSLILIIPYFLIIFIIYVINKFLRAKI